MTLKTAGSRPLAAAGHTAPRVSHRVAVAASGGRDSTALLHVTRKVASALGIEVHALHVHHGLVAQADAWRDQLVAQCERWRVPCLVHHLEGRPAKGDSIEAWARRERYAALAQMAREVGAALVLLAHHRRDQAETFLLQALRGAGASGLASMPREFERDGTHWARPWLDMPREAIEAYVRRHRLRFVDDASNDDPRFARNRLRLAVWPALKAAFPEAQTSLVAAARRAQEAAEALAELADEDLARVGDDRALNVERWRELSPARQANVLREWLRRETGRGAPESLVGRLLVELLPGTTGRWPLFDGVELRVWRDRLQLHAPEPVLLPSEPVLLDIRRGGTYRVPGWQGALRVVRVRQGGVALQRLHRCELRPRIGAERFQAGPNRPLRSLKKQFQAAGVAPWAREAPLLYGDGMLLFVPGLGIDARALAAPAEPQVMFHWLVDQPQK